MDYLVDYLPENETQLRDFLSTRNPFLEYVQAIKTEMPGGANIVGVLAQRMKALWAAAEMGDIADRFVYAPGDRTLNFGDQDTPAKVGLGAPIAYDIWYLFHAGNILKFGGKGIEETMAKMEAFFDAVDQAKPLRPPTEDVSDDRFSYPFSSKTAPATLFGSLSPGEITAGSRSSEYAIKEGRFETWLTGNSAMYPSDGPKVADPEYAGYIAFPVGPLGVMWRISLATASSLSSGLSSRVFPVDATNNTIPGGDLLPPFDLNKKETCGEMMMNRGYLIDDDSLVEKFADGPGEKVPFHWWLRYWIKLDNTEIVPGEFCGLLCRPWPLHCWWHQETAPIVYSGHWVETEFYTSGIVKEVIPPEAGETGNRYRVWVKNEEIIVKSTDFFEYQVDERVGLLKTWRSGAEEVPTSTVGGSGQSDNFNWRNLKLLDNAGALTTEWVIVPAGFYEKSGGSVGGA